MSVTNHNNSGRGLPGPILGIKNLRPGLCPSQVERNNDVPLFAVDARNT